MIGVLFVETGLALSLLGVVCLVHPLHRIGIPSRPAALAWLSAGLAFLVAGFLLPAPLTRIAQHRSLLDDFIPEYHFSERHEIGVHASPDRVFAAVRAVTAHEIRFFRLLTWIRAPRIGKVRESILAPSSDMPILDVALRSGFLLLAERPSHEIVFGTLLGRRPAGIPSPEEYRVANAAGLSKAVMNFRIEDQGSGWCRLTTETRVFSTDSSARRAFAIYWRVIYPGSALIRRMWLDAVRRRAERSTVPAGR